MGYTIKQKIDICLKAESNPDMTQADLAIWAKQQYGSSKPPSQTTISRILCAKNDLIASKEVDFQLVRRRKQSNPILRRILTEWVTQAAWENIPITTPIIQLTANAIWNRLPTYEKDGNGIFNQKWCNHFMKKLNIDLKGDEEYTSNNPGNYQLDKVWKLDEKLDLKNYLVELIKKENYRPQDIFTIEEFQLFYSLPLDQIFDVSSIDKGLKQSSSSTENSLTIMIGTNIDGSEKLTPLVVGKYDKFDVTTSSLQTFKNVSMHSTAAQNIMNKISELYNIVYKSNINKWITSGMFQNYLLSLDHKLSSTSPERKILILLDDSSSHRIINLKFTNIKLCFLKNNSNHKNPYNSLSIGSKFDCLPTSFGIVEEFKILYRQQQYSNMIDLQMKNSKRNQNEKDEFSSNPGVEVLSESEYHVPLIKVIEWIKIAWDALLPEKVYISWKKSHLINFKNQWPSSDINISNQASASLQALRTSENVESTNTYDKLSELMSTLSVVIPWEINELLGLVNERSKITLSYVSIEEIIGSCLLEAYDSDESGKEKRDKYIHLDDNSDWFNTNDFLQSESENLVRKQVMNTSLNSSGNSNLFPDNDYPEYLTNDSVSNKYANANDMLAQGTNTHVLSRSVVQLPQYVNTLQTNVSNKANDLLAVSRPKTKSNTTNDIASSHESISTSDNNLNSLNIPGNIKQSSVHEYETKRRHLLSPTETTNAMLNMPFNNTAFGDSFRTTHTAGFLNGNILSSEATGLAKPNVLLKNMSASNEESANNHDVESMKLLHRLIEIQGITNSFSMTDSTVYELKKTLRDIESRNITGNTYCKHLDN